MIQELDGREYTVGDETYTVNVGQYYGTKNGPVTIQIWGEYGPVCRLTVNLEKEMHRLKENEIFVKGSELPFTKSHLAALGFVMTEDCAIYGPFLSVANIWEIPCH